MAPKHEERPPLASDSSKAPPLKDFTPGPSQLDENDIVHDTAEDSDFYQSETPYPQKPTGSVEVMPPPIVQRKERWRFAPSGPVSEQHRQAASDAIQAVKDGSHFSLKTSKYINNLLAKEARASHLPNLRRFDADTIANDLDYGDALKEPRLSLSRLTTGIADGFYQRIKVGGVNSLLNRQPLITVRARAIDALRRRAEQEKSKPLVAEFLHQLSDEIADTNDRDRMLAGTKWWQRPFADLSDGALGHWRQEKRRVYQAEIVDEEGGNPFYSPEAEAQELLQKSQEKPREELDPIKIDD